MIANRLNKINILNSVNGLRIGGKLIEPDFQDYLNLLTTPLSAAQKKKLNTIYVGIKDGLNLNLISNAFDFLYNLGAETAESSLKNLAKDAHHAVAVNSPAFVQYEGWTGGIGKWIDTNYNPNTQGANYTLNNASMGIYSRTDLAATVCDMGLRTDTTDYTAIFSKINTGAVSIRIHNDSLSQINQPVTNSLGLFVAARNGNTPSDLYGYQNKNTLTKDNTGNNTTSIPNYNLYILARNYKNTPEAESGRQIAFAFAGRYFNTTEVGIITDVFEEYMDSNGKGVIA